MRIFAPLLVGLGVLLVPGVAHAECTTPELPVVGCPLPASGASPSPSPSPSPSASPSVAPSPASSPVPVAVPVLTAPPVEAVAPVISIPAPVPAPVIEPPTIPVPVLARPQVATVVPVAAPSSPLPGVVASSFALVVFGLLALPLLLGFLAGLRPTAAPSGGTVNTTRTRLWTGLGVLALAAVVGGVGWYRISGEPLLNRQIPFLASAGILVVLLSVLGGALIVAEQLKGDQHRIGELEDAVRALTEALSPMIEQPARRAELSSEVLQS